MNKNVLYSIGRGLRYEDGRVIGVTGVPLKPKKDTDGYEQVTISRNGGGNINVSYHKLVYYFETGDENAFNPDYEIHHIDKDKTNNKIENLQLMDRFTHRSMEKAGNKNYTKLTWEQVNEIRTRYAQGGVFQRELAVEYGVSREAIRDVVNNVHWKS